MTGALRAPQPRREDDDLDIDAIIEANKETLPILPGTYAPVFGGGSRGWCRP